MKEESKIRYVGSKGIPMVSKNYVDEKVSDLRIFRPTLIKNKCVQCTLCWILCPQNAIKRDKSDFPVFDYDKCNGCLICLRECPVNAIEEERERK